MTNDGPLYQRDPEAWQAYLAEGNRTQPRKRVSADVLFRDEAGRILLVDPQYKPDWDLPGGMAEANEPPLDTARREIAEELGIDYGGGRLLVVDWVAPHGPWDDSLALIFDGGVLLEQDGARIRLLDGELNGFRFVPLHEAGQLLRPLRREPYPRSAHRSQRRHGEVPAQRAILVKSPQWRPRVSDVIHRERYVAAGGLLEDAAGLIGVEVRRVQARSCGERLLNGIHIAVCLDGCFRMTSGSIGHSRVSTCSTQRVHIGRLVCGRLTTSELTQAALAVFAGGVARTTSKAGRVCLPRGRRGDPAPSSPGAVRAGAQGPGAVPRPAGTRPVPG